MQRKSNRLNKIIRFFESPALYEVSDVSLKTDVAYIPHNLPKTHLLVYSKTNTNEGQMPLIGLWYKYLLNIPFITTLRKLLFIVYSVRHFYQKRYNWASKHQLAIPSVIARSCYSNAENDWSRIGGTNQDRMMMWFRVIRNSKSNC